ncbi:putative ribonuclease H-like domain-containing protein [Tanacetum coccineum]
MIIEGLHGFFLATKDETSGILKSFITRIENLVDHKVKVIRCDNGTEFMNREMKQFCEMKGILRQFSVAKTPQQNGVAERRNRTLIKAARTMLSDSKLPTTFWAEAINSACYVQNRVLVVKPHNKTSYEVFNGRTPTLSFMRPFGCLVTILNTIDHLGKFDGKADEGFFVGYSLNSKAFRVFNSRTRIMEKNVHIKFSQSTPNAIGTQSNGFEGTKASDNAGQARKETKPVKDYILLPLWTTDPLYSKDPKSSYDDGSKPSSDDGKKVDEDPRKDNECKDQEKEDNINNTNNVNIAGNVNTVSSTINAASTNEVNNVDDEDDGAVADMNNLDTTIKVRPNPTTRIHKDHPLNQVKQKKNGIFISQDKYVAEILKKFRFTEVKTASTPMVTQKPLLKDEDGEEVDVHMYRSMIGSLMYLTSSRPDIMFVVCACARYQFNLKVSHLHAVKRIFRLISWQCKKQTVVANSPTEAKYVAVSSCCG